MDIGGTAAGLFSQGWNMKFAEEMAGSQYQRAVADMKAAGLNPNAVFGSGGGSPSSAPGGQSGTAMGGELTGGITNMIAAAKDLAATDVMKQEAKNKEQENKLIAANTASAEANARSQEAESRVKVDSANEYNKRQQDSGIVRSADTLNRLIPLNSLLSGIGSFFGGRSSAKQSTPKAAATMAPQKSSSAKNAAASLNLLKMKRDDYTKEPTAAQQKQWYKNMYGSEVPF